jgi:magnesium-transporting ATPase (P-type)
MQDNVPFWYHLQFWFAIFSGWSGQTIYDQWFVTFYNVIFTSLPVIAAGMRPGSFLFFPAP